jgi:hypothetical protein
VLFPGVSRLLQVGSSIAIPVLERQRSRTLSAGDLQQMDRGRHRDVDLMEGDETMLVFLR